MRAGVVLVVFLLALLAALCLRNALEGSVEAAGEAAGAVLADGAYMAAAGALGGGALRRGLPRRRPDPAASPNLVVDTLNLVHWLGRAPSLAQIERTILETAPTLKKHHKGRIVYVLKDRDSEHASAEAVARYHAVAQEAGVDAAVAERYWDPPGGVPPSAAHSSRGRDDHYTALVAARNRCAVLSADRFRDFAEFRQTLQPYYVTVLSSTRARPGREHVRPEARAHIWLRRPAVIHPQAYFPPPAAGSK